MIFLPSVSLLSVMICLILNNMFMQVKVHPPVTVLSSSHRTTLKQLDKFGPVIADIYKEASGRCFISGPLYWIYHGLDGKPDTEFTLEIALPIQGDLTSSKFEVKELPSFKAIQHLHEGDFKKLPESYELIMQYIDAHKIPLQDESRELYFNIDFDEPEHNLTQIQVGVL